MSEGQLTAVPEIAETPALATHPVERKWLGWVVGLGLMLIVGLFNYWMMPGEFWYGDPFTWRQETHSLLDHHWFDLDIRYVVQSSNQSGNEYGQYFVNNENDGKYYSKYGITNSIVAIPPMWWQSVREGHLPEVWETPDLWIYNVYYLLIDVLACGVLFALSGRYTKHLWARVFFVLAAFYATYYWYYQRSQGSEAYQVLFFLCFVYCLVNYFDGYFERNGRPGFFYTLLLMAMWFFVATLLFSRIVFGILIPIVGIIWLIALLQLPRKEWMGSFLRNVWALVIPGTIIVALLLWVNYVKFGGMFKSGYHVWKPEDHLPSGSLREWADGLFGYLFDPNGSMFLHFPLLLFALFWWKDFFRKYRFDALVIAASFGAMVLILAKTPTWRGEWTYGPRYLVFGLPAAALPCLLFLDWLSQRRQWLSWRGYAAAGVLAWTTLYSTYLQYQVIESHFWIYYSITYGPNTELRGYDEITRAFLDHSAGRICSDIRRNINNLDALLFVRMIKKYDEKYNIPSDVLEQFKAHIREQIGFSNFYWVQKRLEAKAAS